MTLSDSVILEEKLAGRIFIGNFKRENLNPNSYDLTLAPELKYYEDPILDVRNPNREIVTKTMDENGFVLYPGTVYLYCCNEKIGVHKNIRAKVEGKSSLGRLGLFVHVTAGFIDTGFQGSLVLELVATQPIRIYPNMKIAQIEFTRVEGEILESYDKKIGSKYHNQQGVQESLYHKNFQIGS